MYSITYQTKKGESGVMTTTSSDELKKKVLSLFRQRLLATIYKDGNIIGKIWKDDSQRLGWNWSIKME